MPWEKEAGGGDKFVVSKWTWGLNRDPRPKLYSNVDGWQQYFTPGTTGHNGARCREKWVPICRRNLDLWSVLIALPPNAFTPLFHACSDSIRAAFQWTFSGDFPRDKIRAICVSSTLREIYFAADSIGALRDTWQEEITSPKEIKGSIFDSAKSSRFSNLGGLKI